jgi:hypothetical protein
MCDCPFIYISLSKQVGRLTMLKIRVFTVVSLTILLLSDVYFVQDPVVAVAADVPWEEKPSADCATSQPSVP